MRVGIIGGGQLAQMTIQAGASLGLSFSLLALESDESAPTICPDVTRVTDFNYEALAGFISSCDLVTFDHELVDPAILENIGENAEKVFPSAGTLRLSANKARQRDLLATFEIPIPDYFIATNGEEMAHAVSKIGFPVVAKAAHGGYDGRGVFYLESEDDVTSLLGALPKGFELIVEERLAIDSEIAVLVARGRSGESIAYPVVRTVQVDSICNEAMVPSGLTAELEQESVRIAIEIARLVDAVGILAIEMFVVDGKLLVNELAPRPHNSGHLTIEACSTSQFENHLRGVIGLPLGSTELLVPFAAMVNVLGGDEPADLEGRLAAALEVQGAHLHLYHKSYRKGRKLGHVTVVGEDPNETLQRARRSVSVLLS